MIKNARNEDMTKEARCADMSLDSGVIRRNSAITKFDAFLVLERDSSMGENLGSREGSWSTHDGEGGRR